MRLFFAEQDMIDSVCVFVSSRHGIDPQRVEAELFFDETTGFSATANGTDGWRRYQLNEQDLIDAVAIYLAEYHNFDPQRLGIELFYDTQKGFYSVIDQH